MALQRFSGLNKALIKNCAVSTSRFTQSINPATGESIGDVSSCGRDEVLDSIQAAKECFSKFRTSLPSYRADLLLKWSDEISKNASTLAELVTLEMGKPLSEAKGEVLYGNSFLPHFAAQIRTGLTGEVLTPGQARWRPISIRQPVGVVATITPWNFPIAMVTRKAGAAIAAGCSVINAPSEDTPLTSLFMGELAVKAGFPEGLFNVIPCAREDKQVLGETLCQSEDVACLSFTGSTEVLDSIQAAKECFSKFRTSLPSYRADLLLKWSNEISKNASTLAELVTLEMGKPLSEAKGEVLYGNSFLPHFAAQIRTGLTGEVLTPGQARWRPISIRQPVGVVATITPWNFPIAMVTRKAGAAIAAGCSVINAPSEDTPLTSLFMGELAVKAGFPEGLFNVIPCAREDKQVLGETLCQSEDVACLSFTGSTEVGKLLYRQCGDTIKRLHLELGGNAPFIVFQSADVDRAVSGCMLAKFRNAGQACIAANRILVHESLYSEFVEKLATRVCKLKVGNGLDNGISVGPLVNSRAFERVSTLLGTSQHETITKPDSNSSPFVSPRVVLCGSDHDTPLFHTEIFGPVAPVYSFSSEEEAVRLANNTRYGLQAFIFTRDLAQSWRVSEELEYGMVAVNEGAISSANNPFGGWKESGIGREAGHVGIHEFQEDKLVCFGL
eukprot:sb/3462740/